MNLRFLAGVILSLAVFTTSLGAQDSSFRRWTTNKGQRSTVRLKVVEVLSRGVKLQREDNGKVVTMSFAQLSEQDREYLKSMSGESAAPMTNGAGDWPQWRGPNRDGKSPATGLLDQWPSDGPNLVWNITGLGNGYSTPAIVGDRIYILGSEGNREFLFALSADDGSQIWKYALGEKIDAGGFKGPKGTPTVDGNNLYAIGSDGTLACVDAESGESRWTRNLKSDFGGQHGHWAYAESPLIDGDKLVCTPGGQTAIVALNKNTGQPIWRSPIARFTGGGYTTAGYASTIAATLGGTKQYVAFLSGGVVGVSADKGEPLWRYDAPANGTANCSTPVASGNSVFAASGYNNGGGRADIVRGSGGWNAKEAYFQKKIQNHHGGFILHEGFIYGTNDSSLLCLDWRTGDIQWQERSVGKGSISFAEGNLYVRGESGAVALVEASPNGYNEKGRFNQPDRSNKKAWAHPVVADGKLYLHDDDRLLCFDISR